MSVPVPVRGSAGRWRTGAPKTIRDASPYPAPRPTRVENHGRGSLRHGPGGAAHPLAPQGRRRHSGHRREVLRQPGHGHRPSGFPFAVSPGRAGFHPDLSLSYDSGAGNGPFGHGFHLSVPQITRKTDKGLPQYDDANDSDVFILSGAEDLVPKRLADAGWQKERFDDGDDLVERYVPRVEGLFARIEKRVQKATGVVYWQATTKDNVTSTYGRIGGRAHRRPAGPAARLLVAAGGDARRPRQRHRLPVQGRGPGQRPARRAVRGEPAHGRRADRQPLPQAHPLRQHRPVRRDAGPRVGRSSRWSSTTASTTPPRPPSTRQSPGPAGRIPSRPTAPGFEVRTYRLCRRVLMFHRMAELGATPCLVRSTDFAYADSPVLTQLVVGHADRIRPRSRDARVHEELVPAGRVRLRAAVDPDERPGARPGEHRRPARGRAGRLPVGRPRRRGHLGRAQPAGRRALLQAEPRRRQARARARAAPAAVARAPRQQRAADHGPRPRRAQGAARSSRRPRPATSTAPRRAASSPSGSFRRSSASTGTTRTCATSTSTATASRTCSSRAQTRSPGTPRSPRGASARPSPSTSRATTRRARRWSSPTGRRPSSSPT